MEHRDQGASSDDVSGGQGRGEYRIAAAGSTGSFFASGSSAGNGITICGPLASCARGQPRGLSSPGRRGFAAQRSGEVSGIRRRIEGQSFKGSQFQSFKDLSRRPYLAVASTTLADYHGSKSALKNVHPHSVSFEKSHEGIHRLSCTWELWQKNDSCFSATGSGRRSSK